MSECSDRQLQNFGTCFTEMLINGFVKTRFDCENTSIFQIADAWVHQRVRVLVRGVDQDDEIRHACAALNLSPLFVETVISSYDGASDRCAALSPDVAFAQDGRLSRRVRDVAAALILGGKPILCPFSGMRAVVRDSLNLHTFLHRHDQQACIILPDWRIDQCASDRCWYFPSGNLILVSVSDFDGRIALIRTAARVMANHERVTAYLSTSDRSLMVSEDANGHIGHYIWNVVSGWSRLFSIVDPEYIDTLASYSGWQVFGGVTELYPDHAARAGSVVRPDSEEALYDLILERKAVSLVLLDGHVTASTAERIAEWSQQHCSSLFLAEVERLRQLASPLIMVTLRTENRAWIEQQDGHINIIQELALDYPKVGIIIDGLNAGMAQVGSHGWMSLDDEQAIADAIIHACPDVRIYNALGCLPQESIVLAQMIDVFLAPIGAGLAKTRWVANKPGVGFSNTEFLEPGNYQGFLYDHFRDSPVPMRYVGQAEVQNVGDARHGETWRSNFSMCWRAPLRELKALLQAV